MLQSRSPAPYKPSTSEDAGIEKESDPPMSIFLIFDALLIVLFALSSFFGVINFTRAGQVLIGIAVLNFTLAVFSYFGWPVLRGDISNQSPLTRLDSIERQSDRDQSKQERPSRSFVFGLIGLGVVAFAVGLLLIPFK